MMNASASVSGAPPIPADASFASFRNFGSLTSGSMVLRKSQYMPADAVAVPPPPGAAVPAPAFFVGIGVLAGEHAVSVSAVQQKQRDGHLDESHSFHESGPSLRSGISLLDHLGDSASSSEWRERRSIARVTIREMEIGPKPAREHPQARSGEGGGDEEGWRQMALGQRAEPVLPRDNA